MVGPREGFIKLKIELDEASRQLIDRIREAFQEVKKNMIKPTLGRTVWYRGNQGYYAMRAATVSCTVNELIQDSVDLGRIQPLESDMHVHLHVFTPSPAGFFPEFNVPFGQPGEDGLIPPGTWCWPKIIK